MYTIYSKPMCPQCDKVIAEYKKEGKSFEVKKLGVDYELEDLFDVIANTNQPNYNPRAFPIVVFEGNTLIL